MGLRSTPFNFHQPVRHRKIGDRAAICDIDAVFRESDERSETAARLA